MPICFDIETEWQSDAYGFCTWDASEAWDHPVVRRAVVTDATAFIANEHGGAWQSFSPAELGDLCALVAGADVAVTYHGRCWDIPVIGQNARNKTTATRPNAPPSRYAAPGVSCPRRSAYLHAFL
jgi:hypothetical protein